jgi:glycosyltransferase involved in cell wall biosynthesis
MNRRSSKPTIGIAITTHNRNQLFIETYRKIKQLAPTNSRIVVVDDASQKPVKEADYRFEQNVGIARAKNKCLELLDDCKHIFLFDDDCYPIHKDWYKPYINSAEPHLMYIYDTEDMVLYEDNEIVGYKNPRGCMLYLENKVLDVVGGMDINYARWGFEHPDLSNRIFNNGLTSFRYADVKNSNKYIYSLDERNEVTTTVNRQERNECLNRMRQYYNSNKYSQKYCNYKINNTKPNGTKNIVLTCYYTGVTDTQRGTKWKANYSQLKALIDSVTKHNIEIVIINDCFDVKDTKLVKHVRVKSTENPYFQRWFDYYKYLRANLDIGSVYCVDGTDVEMLNNPFLNMQDKLYTGDEPLILKNQWLIDNHKKLVFIEFIGKNPGLTLLNAGVVGGYKNTILQFAHDIWGMYIDYHKSLGMGDMAAFNYIAYKNYKDKLEFGRKITTVFKAEERTNAYWKHK